MGRPDTGTRGVLWPGVRRDGAGSGAPSLAASLPYGLFGLGTGLLVLCTADPAGVVALTLSMGPAEWLLHRFRGESRTRLRILTTAREFRRATVRTLARCLGGYLAALLVLALTTCLLWPDTPPPTAVRLLPLLLVGVVLWLGLLLQAFGAVRAAAAVCALAAGAQLLAPTAGRPALAAGAAVVLAVLTCALLIRPTAHRA